MSRLAPRYAKCPREACSPGQTSLRGSHPIVNLAVTADFQNEAKHPYHIFKKSEKLQSFPEIQNTYTRDLPRSQKSQKSICCENLAFFMKHT